MSAPQNRLLWAPQAWVGARWQESVLFETGADGCWARIEAGVAAPPNATVLSGPALPGLVNAHSHAFQRAFAGLAERRSSEHDDFWSWRDRMYGAALAIEPAELKSVATALYRQMLAGGYTQVCEFHYLHHAPDGRRYDDAATMSLTLVQAAADAGIGITLLPVLYERAGFAAPKLRDDQRRFASDVDFVLDLRRAARGPCAGAGAAIHSLRAAAPASMRELVRRLAGHAAPIHIHIAEQMAEVDDCLTATGTRPIEWLAREFELDRRWQLVHATHALPAEIDAVAASGAGVVLCPSTEANLGDGVPDLPRWLSAGVPLSIGSDSHVGLDAAEELRWLEYAQRLVHRKRNVAADPAICEGSSAARLFQRCLAGGGAAAGLERWGFERGARADLLVLRAAEPGAAAVPIGPAPHALDTWVFAGGRLTVGEIWVAGRRIPS
jgi:formimidoylglutamate deiminase